MEERAIKGKTGQDRQDRQDGQDGQDGQNGQNGQNGQECNCPMTYFVFKPLSANDNEVIFFKATMHAWFNECMPNEVKLAAAT